MAQEEMTPTAAAQEAASGETVTGKDNGKDNEATAKTVAKKGDKAKKKAPTAKKQTPKASEGTTGDDAAPDTDATSALVKIGKDALRRNPSMHTVYVTSDGTAFGSATDAENHARTLECKSVATVTK